MDSLLITYLIFGVVIGVAVVSDLGLLSKKSHSISIKEASWQTIFWIALAMASFLFVWFQNRQTIAVEYISAYLMEWSLSIDNIFVFLLIFSFFKIKKEYYARVLLLGILMAIIFRIIFIAIGIALVTNFSWILYIFGAFLIYTGFKMFFVKHDNEFDPEKSIVYRVIRKILPVTNTDAGGRYTTRIGGKKYFTLLFVVMIMLATTDIVFALDSIPAG